MSARDCRRWRRVGARSSATTRAVRRRTRVSMGLLHSQRESLCIKAASTVFLFPSALIFPLSLDPRVLLRFIQPGTSPTSFFIDAAY